MDLMDSNHSLLDKVCVEFNEAIYSYSRISSQGKYNIAPFLNLLSHPQINSIARRHRVLVWYIVLCLCLEQQCKSECRMTNLRINASK